MKYSPLSSTLLIALSAAVLSACGGSSSSSQSPGQSASTNEVNTALFGNNKSSTVLEAVTLAGNEDVINDNEITTVQVHDKESSDFSVSITLRDVTSTDENTLGIYFLDSSVSVESFPATITSGHGHAVMPITITGLLGGIECEYSGTLNNIDCNGKTLDLSKFKISEKIHVFAAQLDSASQSLSYSTPLSIQFN